ncbi:MAG: hypothetical protein WBW41_14795 [Verrucomicrobiia bacterium]
MTVVFFTPAGVESCRVDFPRRVFAAISAEAKKLGVSLDKFFELAFRQKLAGPQREPARVQSRPKTHKHFFQINMAQSEQKELRALAAAFGIELRFFLSRAVSQAKRELAPQQA